MSIKSDKWIRKMAAEGMIEPFESDQVRYVDKQTDCVLWDLQLWL